MKRKLSQISRISSGVYEKTSPAGDARYLQSKHFDDRGRFMDSDPNEQLVLLEKRLEKHRLQQGDVLLIAKGERNIACLYEAHIGPAVASSTFLVIRPEQEGVLPAYLQWFLNTKVVQERLGRLAKGTRIQSLSKKAVGELDIPLPDLTRQNELLHLQTLWQREQSLLEALLREKAAYYEQLLLNSIRKFA